MKRYYVNKNKQINGDNEVHKSDCFWMPNIKNRDYLGVYDHCRNAVLEAKNKGYNANGCYYCSNSCHTK